jgi:HEPN domain-containing protein
MVDTTKYNEWFKKAKVDFNSAEILYKYEGENEIICFHLQQAVEKYFKGYLIYKTGLLQEGHNLRKLCIKAKEYNSNLNNFVKDCAFLNDFYIETRYPVEQPLIVSDEDVQESFEI